MEVLAFLATVVGTLLILVLIVSTIMVFCAGYSDFTESPGAATRRIESAAEELVFGFFSIWLSGFRLKKWKVEWAEKHNRPSREDRRIEFANKILSKGDN